MVTMNFPRKSPRGSTKNERNTESLNSPVAGASSKAIPSSAPGTLPDSFWELYFDHSSDMVARVRAAREAAQLAMEEFGDPSEYEVRIIHGQKRETPESEIAAQKVGDKRLTQASLDFSNEERAGTKEKQ